MTAARRPTAAELMTGKARPKPGHATRPDENTIGSRPDDGAGQSQPATPNRDKGPNLPSRPPRPVRVTIDLDRDRYTAINRWLAAAAAEVSPDARRISLAAAVRAMIDVVTRDRDIALIVADQLRREREGK